MLVLVTENQLDQWVRANARDSQGFIVELIWRLVLASCSNPKECRFPLGDSIGQHGPDGILDTPVGFEPFVPEGRSYWEIGTGLKARDKATSDYKDLTNAVPESIRRDTTFIFVTPLSGRRDWEYTWKPEAQAAWREELLEKQQWKDIRIIDGTKLVDWLHRFPAVELWLAGETVGHLSRHIETPEQRWQMISSGSQPTLPPSLFLANRDEAIAKLKEIFDGTIKCLKLITRYPEQVAGFVSAYLASLDNESRIQAAGRCLIVSDINDWQTLCTSYQGRNFILIADTGLDLSGDLGIKLIQQVQTAGHAFVFGTPYGGVPDSASVFFPMPSRYQIQEELTKAGYSEERARTLAQKSSGNMTSLVRLLKGVSIEPEWARWSEASDIAIALLVGAWSEGSEADRKAIETLAGSAYEQWIARMREVALRASTPLINQEKQWKFIQRYEGWYVLGPRLSDEHLERLKQVAVTVLQEKDPQFDLPKEERHAAQIYGKVLMHSHLLRKGLAESLALLGSHFEALKSCSRDKAEVMAALAVREILQDADWMLWASLNDVLPLLAEAAPEEFLNAVEKGLRSNPCLFDEIFAQETGGAFGRNYISGLLWALETLAWEPDYLTRVVVCLGELAARDPGGSWANRPINSLTGILLPWLPQTCAPIDKRVVAVRTLLKELPEIGWSLLINLPREVHQVSSGTRRPSWRETIPEDWRPGVTNCEYWEQVSAYAELAIDAAGSDVERISILIDHFDSLPEPAFERLIKVLDSDSIRSLAEEKRLTLWNHLRAFVSKHRRFPNSKWALPGELLNRIEQCTEQLAPSDPLYLYRPLFTDSDFELYEETGKWEEQQLKLNAKRDRGVSEILQKNGIEGAIQFAESVNFPGKVGYALGSIADERAEKAFLPHFLDAKDVKLKEFVRGFILRRYYIKGWDWCDNIVKSDWKPAQIGEFLACLPFTKQAWDRASQWLQKDESEYWTRTGANVYQAEGDLSTAIDKLITHDRPLAAINCLYTMIREKKPIDANQCVRALLAAISSSEPHDAMDSYNIVELIKTLQAEPSVNREDLWKVEWAYLPLLDSHSGAGPQLLERELAENPEFFCEVIRLISRSENKDQPSKKPTEGEKAVARHAWRLLYEWKIPPGMQEDGTFSEGRFTTWLQRVKALCAESGHLQVAFIYVGQVLIHAPADPNGLWIHRTVAEALDDRAAEHMRRGFSIGVRNSRGAHVVDPTGKPERELAEQFRRKAEDVENAGFHRFAVTLRSIADHYNREAKRIKARHRQELLDQ